MAFGVNVFTAAGGTQVYVNDETRTLLKIMKFRAIGLWHGELMHNAATMESYSQLLHEPCDEDEFALRVGRLLLKSLQDGSTLGATLASRLCPEFASIFWAQLSDRLIGQQECDYKNFGIFRSSRATGQIRVAFEPSDVVLRGPFPNPCSPLPRPNCTSTITAVRSWTGKGSMFWIGRILARSRNGGCH